MRTLILGLGNPILGDDSIGLRVAEAVQLYLAERLPAHPAGDPEQTIEVDVEGNGGLRLMERLVGYDRAIIIDAICTGAHPAGSILQLGPDDLPTQHSASAHDMTLPTGLRLATTMGLKVPAQITIVAVDAEQVLDFDEHLSPAVEAALPAAVATVLGLAGIELDHPS